MASLARQPTQLSHEERVLEMVRALLSELGHESAVRSASPASHLDRDLALGSLERVELLVRLESTFGIQIGEKVLAEAETVLDLIAAVGGSPDTEPGPMEPGNRAPDKTEASAQSGSAIADGGYERTAASNEFASSTGIAALSQMRKGRALGIPEAETFQDVLRYRARADARRPHLMFYDDGDEGGSFTFGDLFEGAERVAANLAQRGIGRGDSVALMLPTCREFFQVFAGILLAGATPAPIYPPFRADRIAEYAERQSAILANAGARLIVTFREAASVAKLLKPLAPTVEAVVTAEALRQQHGAGPLVGGGRAQPEDLGLLQYTSGSTGRPKGVMLTHANLLANVRAAGEALEIRDDDVGVSWLPLYHDMGLIGAWLLPLYFGRPVVIMSPLSFLARPFRWLDAFHRYRGTITAAPNFAYELAAAKVSDEEISALNLSSWRAALNGAEPVLPATLDRFTARFAPCGFRREALLPVYGLAEACLGVTVPEIGHAPRIDVIERAALAQEGRAVPATAGSAPGSPDVISFVSVGRPLPGHEVRIANARGEDAGERLEGQVWFRGPSTAQGYYRNEQATAALFPLGKGEGWANSGDRGYRADDEIYVTGRVKDIIIHAGHNLYPHEIEDAVARVRGVRKGCIVAFGAPDATSGTERLVIVAESRETSAVGREDLARTITARVTDAVGQPPDLVEIVPPGAIPKTSSGKLRRDATKQRFLAGELRAGSAPVWLQLTRVTASSTAGRLRAAGRRASEILYGCYALTLFPLIVLPAWAWVLTSRSRERAWRITRAALRVYLHLAGWRVRVDGGEHLQANTPRLFVANHTSYADIPVVLAALDAGYHFVAKAEVLSMPFVRTFIRKMGHFAFRREDPRARLQQAEQIEQALRQGESVFVFPEGTFTPRTGVAPFHLGSFKAAIDAQREIVPVALTGTRRALRDGTWLPHRGDIVVTICPPITPPPDSSDWKEVVRVRNLARKTIAQYAREPLLPT